MEYIEEMIQRITVMIIFCLAFAFHMAQFETWREEIRLVQQQIELEQDVGLSATLYE